MTDIPKAIDLIKQVITIHSGHIDGSVAADKASMQQEMDLLQAALEALTGTPMKSNDKLDARLARLSGALRVLAR